MKTYLVVNSGCDDTTEFEIGLDSDELKLIVMLCDINNKNAKNDGCKPKIYIYESYKKIGTIDYYYDEESCINENND